MTTPAAYADPLGRLAAASAELASLAQQHGVPREKTAEMLAEVTHAATVDPEVERQRAQLREDWAAFQSEVSAYLSSAPQVRAQLSACVDRLADLADEVVQNAATARDLDSRGQALASWALSLGEPAQAPPQVVEAMVQGLGHQPGNLSWQRLFLAGGRGRRPAAEVLFQLMCLFRPDA